MLLKNKWEHFKNHIGEFNRAKKIVKCVSIFIFWKKSNSPSNLK